MEVAVVIDDAVFVLLTIVGIEFMSKQIKRRCS